MPRAVPRTCHGARFSSSSRRNEKVDDRSSGSHHLHHLFGDYEGIGVHIFTGDKNICQCCGQRFPTSELSLDHVIPSSMGGKANWGNIVCACTACNVKKGCRTPKHAGMTLVKKPTRPRHNPLVHVHLGHHRYKSWKQFLDHAYRSVELK